MRSGKVNKFAGYNKQNTKFFGKNLPNVILFFSFPNCSTNKKNTTTAVECLLNLLILTGQFDFHINSCI